MPTYCFKCGKCGVVKEKFTTSCSTPIGQTCSCGFPMDRDYMAENAGGLPPFVPFITEDLPGNTGPVEVKSRKHQREIEQKTGLVRVR